MSDFHKDPFRNGSYDRWKLASPYEDEAWKKGGLKVSVTEPLKHFRVLKKGEHQGEVGLQVGRYCDPSYDDIELSFPDGSHGWYRMRDVERVIQGERQ